MTRLRVLHVIGGLELGGAETLLYRLVARPSDEFEHDVICLGEPGWYSRRLEEQGISVTHLGMASAGSSLGSLRRLRALIRDRRADLIQSWMYLANVLAGIAARGSGIPVVWSIHASTFKHLGLASRICAHVGGLAASRLSRLVINCSDHSARRHARFGYARVPVEIIHNGYDPAVFSADDQARSAVRASLDIAPGEFVVGTIARWHSEKDVPTLLRALAVVRNSGVDARCLLIGPDLDSANVELMRAVDDRAIALGRRDDIADLARAFDLHILSSRSEAFPNVVAETMLCGVPNVVTDVGDSRLMVGATGWMVPPRDARSMADAIAQAYREWRDQPDVWQQRRAAARERISDRFSFDRMADAYASAWNRAAGRG